MNSTLIQELLNQGKLEEADRLLQDRLIQHPESADTQYLLGVLAHFKGDLPASMERMREALKRDPRHTDAAICLSVLLNDVGRYDDAKQVFEQANLSVSPRSDGSTNEVDLKFAIKHQELADLYYRYRRYDEAIEEYGKALALAPGMLELRIRRAKSFAKKGFATRAMQELQSLKHEHPDFLPALVQLGLLHYSQGNELDAELEWESVLKRAPEHTEARSFLRWIRSKHET